jgi:hypothetical protein
MEHEFGPWEEVKLESPAAHTAHKNDFGVISEKTGAYTGFQSGRKLRLNGDITKEDFDDCEQEKYGQLNHYANFRTLRVKCIDRAFSDGLDGYVTIHWLFMYGRILFIPFIFAG